MVKLTWSAIAPEWGGRQRAGIDVGKKKKKKKLSSRGDLAPAVYQSKATCINKDQCLIALPLVKTATSARSNMQRHEIYGLLNYSGRGDSEAV